MAASRRRRTTPAQAKEAKPKQEPTLTTTATPGNTRSDLLKALTFIKPGIASGSIIEQSDMVLMDMNRLVSYNDEIAVSHPFSIGHRGGVYANELIKLLQKLPSEEIEINEAEAEDGKNQLILVCGSVEAGFFVAMEVTIPELGIDAIEEWYDLPELFCESVSFCLSSAATDMSKGILTCVNIEEDTILSCDNFRATKKILSAPLPDGIVLNIPRIAVKDLPTYNPTQFAKDENWLHFRNTEGTVFSTRTMAGDFPPVAGLFENVEGEKVPLPKDLKDSLSRAEILASEDERSKNKVVGIEIVGGKIVCSGQGQSGWVTEKVTTSHKGDIPKFFINPGMLAQVLDSVQEATMTGRSLIFQGDGFSHVVALIAMPKVEDEE